MVETHSNNGPDSLEAFFRKRLKDGSLEPPESGWQQLEEELGKMEKEKKRRRFIWFFLSGIVLLCGLTSLWFVFMNKPASKNNADNSKITVTKNTTEEKIRSTEKINNEAPVATNVNAEKITAPLNEEKNILIQLGAFKHPANTGAFKKIPFKVIEEQGNDGYTRYFAETNTKDNSALETIQKAGFADAFVKNKMIAANETSVVKEEGKPEKQPATFITSTKIASKIQTGAVADETKTNEVASVVSTKPDNTVQKTKPVTMAKVNGQPEKNTEEKNNTAIIPASIKQDKTEDQAVSLSKDQEQTITSQENKIPVTEVDTSKKTEPIVVVMKDQKPDTTQKKEELKDSVKTPDKTATVDSSHAAPFLPEWALVFSGGVNSFMNNVQSNLYNPSNESDPLTYNGEAKLQWRPLKYFSFSGGANFTYFTAKQDATFFKFNKHQQSDFIFNSAYGPMAMPMSVMLQGYYFNAPTDTFSAKYSYNASIQTLNIPLEANLHFLNRKKFNLFLGIGANSSFVLAQHSHLIVYKENFNNEASYNIVTVNRFNMMLLLSIGCDVRLNKHWYLTGGPSYKYGLTNMSATSGTAFVPSFLSINAGMKFKF